jgi:predicted Rossmann fold nucleotide-binding protein DprA/Smf involved in DNA uptake
MKLAIVGSRGIKDANIGELLAMYQLQPSTIISGGARGVDQCAADFANANGIELLIFKPDYQKHLQGAPIRRNELIARECDTLLAIWDGESKGTKHVYQYAQKIGKKVILHTPNCY